MKNPKQKLKNILFLVTVLFAFSCSKDVYEEELLNDKITKKKITFEEFSSNKKAIKEFTAAKNELQSTSFERAAYNQDLNIVIDTDNIQLIEIDDYRTYTIPFLAEGRENKVDNMVIVENGNYIDVKFISYNLTKQQLSQMNFGTIDNTILFRNNNAIETECNTIVDKAEIYINPATGQISGYIVTYANPCAGTEGNTYVIQQIDSDGSTGGDGNGGDGSSGNFSSGNNSGILNFWSNLFGNNYSNGGPGSGEIYTLGNGSNGSNASNIGGVTDNWDNTTVLTNPVISTGINMQNATLMLELGAYLNQLKQANPQLNQLLLDNPNIYQYIFNHALQNVPFKQDVKNAIAFALNHIGPVYSTLNQNSNNLAPNEIDVLKDNALNFLLQMIPSQQQWWGNQTTQTKDSVTNYLIANNYSDEGQEFIDEVINLSIDLDMDVMEVWIDKYDQFINGMSVTEKVIYDDLSIKRKLSYIAAAYKANDKAIELYPNSLYNGKGDAYRHTLWNALTTLLINSDLANQLTSAHEEKPFDYQYHYKEKDMDLFNNLKGRNIAAFSNLYNVYENVQTHLNIGLLWYLNNLATTTNRATQNSILTPTNQ
jgi:hypothetical protein